MDAVSDLSLAYLLVIGGCHVACNTCCECVQHDDGGVERSSVVGVEHTHERQPEDEEGQVKDLGTGSVACVWVCSCVFR